jgi:hypothetical protein
VLKPAHSDVMARHTPGSSRTPRAVALLVTATRKDRFPAEGKQHSAAIRSSWQGGSQAAAGRRKGPEERENSQRAQRLLAEAKSFKASRQRTVAAAAAGDPLPLHTAATERHEPPFELI